MKKILVLSFYYYPDLCAGSFRCTSFVNSLKELINKDDIIDIITTTPNRYETFDVECKKYEKIDNNISIYRIDVGNHKSGFIDQSISFSKFLIGAYKLSFNKNYEIIFATSSRLMTAFLGSLIAKRNQSKLYLDMRDIFLDTMNSIFNKKNSKLKYLLPLFKIIEYKTIKSADHINLVSKGFYEYFKEINGKDIYSFYTNGIDEEFLNYNFKKEIKNNKKIITYAGNIGEGQGLENIIPKLSKILNNYEIWIVGDGGRKKQLIENLQKNNIKNVILKKPVTRKQLLEIYKKSDILFLHLNNYEAFKKVLPSKIFEYATTNKFIIAGVDGFAKKFIEKNVSDSLVFKPNDEKDFFNKFKKIIIHNNINRIEFIEKYKRKNIMNKMAKEVYEL